MVQGLSMFLLKGIISLLSILTTLISCAGIRNFTGYGQSKTAVNLFSMELDYRARDYNIRVYAVHPGSIGGTELGREAPLELFSENGVC